VPLAEFINYSETLAQVPTSAS